MIDDRPKYQHFFRCRGCGDRFSVMRLTADPAKVKVPRCPKKRCTGRVRESHVPDIGMDVAAGVAPAQVGAIQVRALDTAMNITMADHGMTDLSDDFRPGAVTAPRLRPDLQAKADAFFSPAKKQGPRQGRVDLSGMFGDRATAAQPNGVPSTKFTAGGGSAIAPILRSQAPGSSPIPPYVAINKG